MGLLFNQVLTRECYKQIQQNIHKMIYNDKLTAIGDRVLALDYIKNLKEKTPNFTLIDVGANANPWTKDYITHVVDQQRSPRTNMECCR